MEDLYGRTEYVCGFLFSEDEKHVALVEKQKPAWQKGCHNGVGGKTEANESIMESMSREFLEETGVLIEPADWNLYANVEGKDWIVFFLRAASDKVFQCKTMETEEIKVVEVRNVRDMKIIPNLNWLIPMALDPNHDMSQATANTVRWNPKKAEA